MKRRSLLKMLAAAGCAAIPPRLAMAHDDSTPQAAAAIPLTLWNLLSIDTKDSALTPDEPSRYWVQFLDGGMIYVKADCNSGSGRYELDGDAITISGVISTLIGCGDDSIEGDFLNALGAATAFSNASDGSDQLVLSIGEDGASAVFAASLEGVVWEWSQFDAGNDTSVSPDSPERYTVQFYDDGSIEVVADCNSGGGEATVDGNQIDITVTATRIACGEGSKSDEFLAILDQATSFVVRDGSLALALPMDSGKATFRAHVPDPLDETATPEA